MNWLLLVIVLTGITSITLGQQVSGTIHCKGKNYQGYIFSNSHNGLQGFIPSCEEIKEVENILRLNIKKLNIQEINQAVNSCPIIHKNLQKYIRQYIGFINSSGQRSIWVNCFWRKLPEASRASKDLIMVNDGCSYFWNVEVDLDSKELKNLVINGSA